MAVMTIQQARSEIQIMARDSDFPTLASNEVDLLVNKSKRQDVNRNVPDSYNAWAASTAYSLGTTVVPDPRTGNYFKCTTSGTSGTASPTWPTAANATVTDGTAVWTLQGAALWTPTWHLAYGIAQGWKIKMAKAVGAYDLRVGNQQLSRSQIIKNCKEMYEMWRKRVSSNGQIQLQGSLRDRRLFQNITNQNDELFIDGQIWWPGASGLSLYDYAESRGFTGVSQGGQWIDP